ncbi:SUN domain-containing protein 3-like [Mugil cephalus]|uniref:SUN domain-containing protein 3-like n=1 Tax=Mugil cephalus TaxID=48193 RepID=UPI001FB5CC86|nr:SUN domain-containing protein 3-like [Mugil cephalus]
MPRRSTQLVSPRCHKDVEPVVSYRETMCSMIRKRQTFNNPPPMKEVAWRRFTSPGFLLVLLLCFGLVYVVNSGSEKMGRHIGELKDEIVMLKSQMNYLLPVSDMLPNFALEPLGARVLHHMTSQEYQSRGTCQRSVSPRIVIQGKSHLVPGRCWAFAGEQGHLSIRLSHKVTITNVTLGHISKALSPTQNTFSAPKEFSVYGRKTLDDDEVQLGTFLYDYEGDLLQTFKLPDHKTDVFSYVTLKVNSNWGNPEYTCLYSFRVHGKLEDGL